MKNRLGLRDEQIINAVNSASKWCSEDYEDGIAAMKKAKYNHDINDNGELNFDDFYNVKGFLQKSWLRLNSLMGNDKSRKINVIKQSERI